jgi:hypothetical protein
MLGNNYKIDAPTVGAFDNFPTDGVDLDALKGSYSLGCVELLPVTPRSPMRFRRAVETIAQYFRREFGYDFTQYDATERSDPRDQVFLWVNPCDDLAGVRALGAACFRWRRWSDGSAGLALAFCWLHPYCRRQGVLSASWPHFCERLGDFVVERPLSPAMEGFLRKVDPEKLAQFDRAP